MRTRPPPMRGQLTVENMVVLLIDMLIFFMVISPIYQPFANYTISNLDPTWGQFYTAQVIFIQVWPLLVLVGLSLMVLNYAQPKYAPR